MNEIIYVVVVFDENDNEIARIPCPFLEWARELARHIDQCTHFGTYIIV